MKFYFVVALMIAGCAHAPQRELAAKKSRLIPIVILHTNDTHGHAWPVARKDGKLKGGFAAQAALVDKIRDEVAKREGIVLLLSAGDINTGTPESDLLSAEPDIRAMNLMRYDAMAVGNHEFDGGVEKLAKQREWAQFPFLSANVSSTFLRLKKVNEPFVVLQREGVQIGILGLTTDTLPKIVLRNVAESLEVKDPITAAQETIPAIKTEGADLLIALSHVGVNHRGMRKHRVIENDEVKLAEEVPELNVVVGGHSHSLLPDGIKIGNTLVVQAGEKGEHLGRVDLLWDREKRKVIEAKATVLPIFPEKGENEKVKTLLTEFEGKVSTLLDEELGRTQSELDAERENIRHQETNFGNFVCDVLKTMSKSDVAIYNGGGIRASIPRGPIRLRDLYRALPFRNTVTTGILTGKQLKQALRTGIKYQNSSGSFLQVAGIQYAVKSGKLAWAKVNGAFVSDGARYKVVSNNFLFGGGDYLEVLRKAAEITDTGEAVEEVLAKYIRAHPIVYAKVDGRIQLD